MLRLISIALSTLMLVQSLNIHIHDILELDKLITHAQFHADEHGDNFLVFLSKHYGELKAEHDQNHQDEKEEHEQLPFQHQWQSASLYLFVLNEVFDDPTETDFPNDNTSHFFYLASYGSLVSDGPFQPPRQA